MLAYPGGHSGYVNDQTVSLGIAIRPNLEKNKIFQENAHPIINSDGPFQLERLLLLYQDSPAMFYLYRKSSDLKLSGAHNADNSPWLFINVVLNLAVPMK